MPIDVTTAMYLLAAIAVAVVIRLMDSPVTTLVVDGKVQWQNLIPTVAGIAIAVPIAAWVLELNVLVAKDFLLIVATGMTGMAAVKALINKLMPPAEPA